jgi:hypothetical protein
MDTVELRLKVFNLFRSPELFGLAEHSLAEKEESAVPASETLLGVCDALAGHICEVHTFSKHLAGGRSFGWSYSQALGENTDEVENGAAME